MGWLIALTVAAGIAQPTTPMSGFLDAAKLIGMCTDTGPAASAARAVCLGYVVGSVDQLMAQQARRDPAQRTICPPKTLTADQAVQAVVRHPTFAAKGVGIGASAYVRFSMEQAYPCTHPTRK
jgi:hypothetical protein